MLGGNAVFDMVAAMGESQPARRKGVFVVLDGTEGCGKSTQSRMLRDRLQGGGVVGGGAGRGVLLVRDPGTTRIGEQVRSILLNPDHAEMNMRCEMLLYMAARAQMMGEVILPALAAGDVVVCDRFVSSTLAYQLGGDGLTEGDIRSVADVAIRGRWPDLTVLLDMPAGASLARVNREKDRIERRPIEYHERVRQNYLAQAAAEPARNRVVRADRDVQAVHEDVWAAVQPLLR
jgi:dTMP kinase